MKNKIKVGLICGGRSGEHEVSLLSAQSIYTALDKKKYEVVLIGIDKQGQWHIGDKAHLILNVQNSEHVKLNNHSIRVEPRMQEQQTTLINVSNQQTVALVDVFFPIIHGTTGEDGSLQGFFELLNVAYVGAGVLGSSVGMDKDIMKRLLRDAGIPIGNFKTFTRASFSSQSLQKTITELQFPIFVKPANSGSSVGVTKAHNQQELDRAISEAFNYDTKILLEQAITGKEIECSVLGNDQPICSVPGEIIPTHEFYDYKAKYIDEHGAELQIPADLPSETISQAQSLAIKTFQILECSGMARVDMFLTSENQLLINEINTLPGFTKISMYPKLWEASGISYPELLNRLIQLAIEKKQAKDQLIRDFKLLDN